MNRNILIGIALTTLLIVSLLLVRSISNPQTQLTEAQLASKEEACLQQGGSVVTQSTCSQSGGSVIDYIDGGDGNNPTVCCSAQNGDGKDGNEGDTKATPISYSCPENSEEKPADQCPDGKSVRPIPIGVDTSNGDFQYPPNNEVRPGIVCCPKVILIPTEPVPTNPLPTDPQPTTVNTPTDQPPTPTICEEHIGPIIISTEIDCPGCPQE